jgi:hypothetical protein
MRPGPEDLIPPFPLFSNYASHLPFLKPYDSPYLKMGGEFWHGL